VWREGSRLHVGPATGNHGVLQVQHGPCKRLLGLTLGVHEADLPRFAAHLLRLQLELLPAAPGVLRLLDPDGNQIDVVAASKSSPDATHPPAARTQAPSRSAVSTVRPLGLSHLLLFSRDVPRSTSFYERAFGMRLSDRSGDQIAFLHTPHGSDHHLLAFLRSDAPGLHHSSWRVGSLDEVGNGAMQMAASGYGQGWGLGRHVLGSNYFHYVRDPWGGYVEFSFDMDYIPAGSHWPAADHDGDDAFYVWGPSPPPDFGANTEITQPPQQEKEAA
jgi:catechol 2,3-dioxygenase-like lactoylglutathione lyase family enzyme